METFSRLRKKLKNYIFTDEFDEKYQSTTTKLIFILFCCTGGFCFHEDVRTGFRRFWIFFNVFNFTLVNGSCLFYYLNAELEDYYSLLIPLPVASVLWAKWGMYIWTFLMRDTFSKILDFLGDKYDESAEPIPPPNQRKKYGAFCTVVFSTKFEIRIITASLCFLISAAMLHDYEKVVNHRNYFVILYPMYVAGEKTLTLRIIIQFVQTVTILPLIFAFVALSSSIFIVPTNFYNRSELLSVFLRETSYSIFLRIDEIYSQEMAMHDGRMRSSLAKISELKVKKALALDELVLKMILAIQQHRRLYSIAKAYTQKVQVIFCLANAELFFSAVLCAFFIPWVANMKSFHVTLWTYIVGVLILVCVWFMYCFVGELFHTMNELVATEIYCSPWYHLEPKDRRLMLAFLSILQRLISIIPFGLYHVNLSLFPETIDNIYSHMQILHTLQLNKNKTL